MSGCKSCGLIGCDCASVADSFTRLCKKCRAEPCTCNGPVTATIAGAQPCNVCRRAIRACICTSHVSVRPMHDEADVATRSTYVHRPFSAAYVDVLVNDAMNLYYSRDAEGLARWLRRVLP